ncbi:MAG: aminopeptidase [Ignavibacteriaceae bacterium]|nr:aminopeptidase [Ignavibacteriaceae bacterium]
MDPLKKAAHTAISVCMGARQDEKILIVSDTVCSKIGKALFDTALELGHEALYVEMKPMRINGEEPPALIAGLMKEFDVILLPTLRSLTHTNARREASALGKRVATFPGITEDIMIRGMSADYEKICARTIKLAGILEAGKKVRVTTEKGTDISFSIEGRKAYASKGLFREFGESGNLPTGEAFLAPMEGTSNGVFIVDGSFASVGLVDKDIRLEVKDGYVVKIEGGDKAKALDDMLKSVGPDAYSIAEFGIGTNDTAKISGVILEDEKVMGTIHIALGNNLSMGGSVNIPVHVDGVVKEPNVWIDDSLIMEKGKFVIDIG